MNNRSRTLRIVLGLLIYLAGIIVSLAVSATMLWGEMEARLYTQQAGDERLHIECPLMIASWETATIHAVVTNTLPDQATKPQVNAFISRPAEPRVVTETLELAPRENRALQWNVDRSDMVFDRVILVNILQRPYRALPSRQGACSILVYSLFGLGGGGTLILLVSIGVSALLMGAGWLFTQLRPLNDFTKSLVQLNGIFLCLILLGLVTALLRSWGWTLLLDAAAVLAITTGGVEVFFSRRNR